MQQIAPDMPSGFARTPTPLTDVRADGAACRVDTFARPDGQIAGIVVDAVGKGIPGFVTVQPADPAEAAAAQRHGGMTGSGAGPDGKFSLVNFRPAAIAWYFTPTTAAA
jgi:hypothetical protein